MSSEMQFVITANQTFQNLIAHETLSSTDLLRWPFLQEIVD